MCLVFECIVQRWIKQQPRQNHLKNLPRVSLTKFQNSRAQDVQNPDKVKYIFWVVDTTSSVVMTHNLQAINNTRLEKRNLA